MKEIVLKSGSRRAVLTEDDRGERRLKYYRSGCQMYGNDTREGEVMFSNLDAIVNGLKAYGWQVIRSIVQ